MAQHLFIVSRQSPDLYSYLARAFSSEPDVTVILDRRRSGRQRPLGEWAPAERRQTEQRAKAEIATKLSTLGYAFVRLN